MKKNAAFSAIFVLVLLPALLLTLGGCGRKNETGTGSNEDFVSMDEADGLPEAEAEKEEKLSDEQALSAIRNYCLSRNPELEGIINDGKYPVYWEVSSSDEQGIVVLFRSYTGAQVRYYIDRLTGETYVTEFVPGITAEEQRTDESFNVKDYSV